MILAATNPDTGPKVRPPRPIGNCTDCGQERTIKGRGRCNTCYMRYHRSKNFVPFARLPLAEKIRLKTRRADSGCLEWTGAFISSSGYGSVTHDGTHYLAHRANYEISVGPIPDGLTIDHLCRNTKCVEPTHLEPVTQAENNRRALPYRPVQEWCKKGLHLLAETAVRRKNGSRLCHECLREYQRAWDRAAYWAVRR